MDLTEEDQIRRDEADVIAINRLESSDEFVNYFLRRLSEKKTALQRDILENDKLSTEDREMKRSLWKEIGRIMVMPEADRAAIRSKLKGSELP